MIVILIKGNTYVYKSDTLGQVSSVDELTVEIENENVVEIIDKEIIDGIFTLKLKSIDEGKTFVEVHSNTDYETMFSIYVHKFGIITFNEYMGYTIGSKIIPLSYSILFF